LEETAFFMDATVNCGKPVVIVGAMRPATAISADGPANLYQAVQAGVFPESKNRGALIIMNDRIGAAYYTQKTHGEYQSGQIYRYYDLPVVNYLDTFKAPEPGYLGGFFNNQPFYYYEAAKPYCESASLMSYLQPDKTEFDVSGIEALPRVDILYGHQETDARIIDFTADLEDVAGIIMASPNGGEGVSEALDRAAGLKPVVRHVRINIGMIAPSASVPEGNSTISAGLVNSHKSRILLQLALATGADPREVFEATLRGTLYG
jgi:L-asparaginase